MNIEQAKEKLLTIAGQQVGYHEIGDNITKYATDYDYDSRLYGFDMNGSPWCDYFVDLMFILAFGFENALRMTYQYTNCQGAACRFSASYYKNHGAFYQYPEVGDQIFFYYGGDINHTGIVAAVSGNYVTVIEGNSSDSVQRLTYAISNQIIAGYGRPKWSVITEESNPENSPGENSEKTKPLTGELAYQIQKGDIVELTKDAVYWSGAPMPNWVLNDQWVVLSIDQSNGRAVINMNKSGTRSIMSPVDAIYLSKVGEIEKETTQPDLPPEDAPSVSGGGLHGDTYTVIKGDTLWGIASKYLGSGTRYKEIKALNGLKSDLIHPGQQLILPGKE